MSSASKLPPPNRLSRLGMTLKPEKMKSAPGMNCSISLADLRICECDASASLPAATSSPSIDASRFSASTARTPPGSDSGSAMHEIDPFCTPWLPAPRTIIRQRASRYSIEQPSALPISASDPVPLVKRTFTPRLA